MRVDPSFSYVDTALGLWIAAYPFVRIADFDSLDSDAQQLFATTYSTGAAAREMGASLQPRVTFGWGALREKILLARHEIDDGTVEVAKLELLRRLPQAPLRAGVELRVTDVIEDMLRLAWMTADTGAVLQVFEVNRSLLDRIGADATSWAAVRDSVTGATFVDMQRVLLTTT